MVRVVGPGGAGGAVCSGDKLSPFDSTATSGANRIDPRDRVDPTWDLAEIGGGWHVDCGFMGQSCSWNMKVPRAFPLTR